MIKERKNDLFFKIINTVLLVLVLIIEAYPLYFVLIASISSPGAVNYGEVWLWPKGFTIQGYKFILEYNDLWSGYKNTIILTLIGTCINLFVTFTGAYALTKSKLPGIKIIMFLLTFTMFFGGGLIPTYILVSKLGMRNTLWALIIPSAASMYNIILVRTYFMKSIPGELIQAAKIDGCSEIRLFLSVVMPLSAPMTATMALFYGVGHWNQFFQALIYISKKELFPLQLVLRELLLMGNEAMTGMLSSGSQSGGNMEYISQMMERAEILKYGVIIIASVPVLAVYPFLQRYFVKGILAGSLKG
jgi:putative aldouronate transport system permease protein